MNGAPPLYAAAPRLALVAKMGTVERGVYEKVKLGPEMGSVRWMLQEKAHNAESMAQVAPQRAPTSIFLILASFLLLYWLTTPPVAADTLRYAGDVVDYAHKGPAGFWNFGHLLWRPWGYVGLRCCGSWFERHFGDTETQAVVRFFVLTNFVCCIAIVMLFWDLVQRLVSIRLATLITIAFCGANCFLAHIKLGAPHLPGLCFVCLSLWLLARAGESTDYAFRLWVLAGVSYAISITLWVAYVLAGFGMLFFVALWPLTVTRPLDVRWRKNLRAALVFLVTSGVAVLIAFAAGAAARGVHDFATLMQWMAEAGNGWSQHLGIVRAATGVPRMLYELASDTVLLKRWFFHDPYNPVHLPELAGALLLKLLFFYIGIAALFWILMKESTARPVLIVLLGAASPLLLFAIFALEPGSPDRYLPAFPFLYIAAAVALSVGSRWRIAYAGVIILLASSLTLNAVALTRSNSRLANEVRQEKQVLEGQIAAQAVVFVPTLHDPFYYVPTTRPLDHSLFSSKYQVVDIIEPGSVRVLHWRSEFATRSLAAWQKGREVWISEHVLARRPEAGWLWVEGDDPRITWAELPNFFQQLTINAVTERASDGFARIAATASNRAILDRLASPDPKHAGALPYVPTAQ